MQATVTTHLSNINIVSPAVGSVHLNKQNQKLCLVCDYAPLPRESFRVVVEICYFC